MNGSDPEAITLAVLGTKVDALTRAVETLALAQTEAARTYVPTAVWSQRNEAVDGRINGLGREIGELRTELRSRRVSWPAVGALAVAAAALLLQLINALGRPAA